MIDLINTAATHAQVTDLAGFLDGFLDGTSARFLD